MLTSHENHLPIYSSYLQLIDPLDKRALPNIKKKPTASVEELTKVVTTCDKVLSSVKDEAVLAYMAVKTDLRPDAAKFKTYTTLVNSKLTETIYIFLYRQMEQQKNVYLECLARKGVALCRLTFLNTADEDEDRNSEISNVWKSIVKFLDPSDAKVVVR